jgi:PAS domain S-box-containing protein
LTYAGKGVHGAQGHAALSPRLYSVHFYESEAVFLDNLSEFVGSALGGGGAAVAIATAGHLESLRDRLKSCGIDTQFATQNNRLLAMDAEQTLAKFMVGGWPDEERFFNTIEPELLRAAKALPRKSAQVAAFSEMMALLWDGGKRDAAVRLKQLWSEVARRHSFSLRCAYPLECFADESQAEAYRRVCSEHTDVVAGESYTALCTDDEQLRMVSALQQKAATLQGGVEERETAQRQQVEVKLRRSEEFTSTVIENSIDCVMVLDLDGRLKYLSPPGQRALEIEDPGAFIGRRWVEFWQPEDRSRAAAALGVALRGGVGSFRGESATAGGTVKSWDVKITPAIGGEGEVERLIAISRDITELKDAQRAAIQAEKLAATGRLAATIAHEINNPLEAVTNFIYLARTCKDVPEDVSRHLEIADRELGRVAQIAQQTLGFYRDNSRQNWTRVAEVIRDVMVIYERKVRNKRLESRVSADPALSIYIKQGELRQALSNLIANAVDASADGGKLWLRAHAARNWAGGMEKGVRFTIADNGTGMAPEVQRQIFVPFFTTKADVGTGIGLWVTKSLIEQQGGFMRFRSRQGEKGGTVMSFFLPQDQQLKEHVEGSAK